MRRGEEEEDTLETKFDLPVGHQEHQQLKEHMICLANRTK